MLCKCEQTISSSPCVCAMCRLVYGPVNLVVCERVHVFMLCMLCVHVQLIKELLSDGSHPVTSKPQESFTSVDL